MYYIINKNTRQTVRESLTPFNIDESVQPQSPLVQLKRADQNELPAFNPLTEKLSYIFTDNDVKKSRTFSYSVKALTVEEIADAAKRKLENDEKIQILLILPDLKNGTGTSVIRQARIERILFKVAAEILK